MINPVCPLTTSQDIEKGIQLFHDKNLDTLLTVREEYLHAFMNDQPLNLDPEKQIPMTQHLSPIQLISWNFCFWKTHIFKRHYETKGSGVFSGQIGFYNIEKTRSVKVSEESDFRLAEALLQYELKSTLALDRA